MDVCNDCHIQGMDGIGKVGGSRCPFSAEKRPDWKQRIQEGDCP